jgi:hypothetical protein
MHVAGRTRDGDVREALEKLFEQDPYLESGEMSTEAEVRTTASEGQVRIRRAPDLETLRVAEYCLIAVRRVEENEHRRPSLCRAGALQPSTLEARLPKPSKLEAGLSNPDSGTSRGLSVEGVTELCP